MVQQVFLDPPEIFLFPLKDTEMLISLLRNRLAMKWEEEEFYFSGWFLEKTKQHQPKAGLGDPGWVFPCLGRAEVGAAQLFPQLHSAAAILILPPHAPHCCSTRATLQPCLEVTQGEGSWSVTPTHSTSINLLVKHQGSFTSVMTFYFITQHAVHEAAFPQCINLVREETPFSPLLCHQCLSEIREHLKCFLCLNSEWLENRLKVPLCTVALYESVFCLTGLNKKIF